MDNILIIRDAARNEAEILTNLAIRSKAYWGYSAEFMAACQQELLVSEKNIESTKYHYAAAEKQGHLAGFCAVQRLSDTEYELEALFVDPQHIGSGVGKALLRYAIDYASTNGGNVLLIQGDPNAAGFYKAAGARYIGTRESVCIPGRYLPLFKISLLCEDSEDIV